ncbi:hypothetical protein CDCA_CDCA17G4475 [Cyanidium caldarium]|uniref:Uncharacterized protein n=1 Tax=Cyanidium caldarium TaxID=2771 RepID=A0AAV9J281_CYACA|nr:hypothetical protein CDCA_CDCA17G4475 [Cyanidium caldarium]
MEFPPAYALFTPPFATCLRRLLPIRHRWASSSSPPPHHLRASSNPPDPARRRLLRALLATAVLTLIPSPRDPSTAVTVAPTPLNPYARRRRRIQYERLLKQQRAVIERNRERRRRRKQPLLETDTLPYPVSALSAFIAAALSTLVVHPIDTIKTRVQATGQFCMLPPAQLYRGVTSNIWKEAPNAAIYLGVYEALKNVFLRLPVLGDWPMLCFFLAGGLGDAFGSVVRVPAEMLNKRLQLGLSANFRDALRDIFLTRGNHQVIRASWLAVLARDVPYGALQIAFYEQLKIWLVQSPLTRGGNGLLQDVVVGALAGSAAAILTTPADVVVTTLSTQNPQSYLETRSFMGVLSTARRILDERGWRGLYAGALQRGLYYAPLIGIFFAIYEACRYVALHPEMLAQLLDAI